MPFCPHFSGSGYEWSKKSLQQSGQASKGVMNGSRAEGFGSAAFPPFPYYYNYLILPTTTATTTSTTAAYFLVGTAQAKWIDVYVFEVTHAVVDRNMH